MQVRQLSCLEENNSVAKKVVILGAGPAGLGAAYSLSRNDFEVIVLEANSEVGGLAKTIETENGLRHDLGPHKLFTQDNELLKLVLGFLPKEKWLVRDKIARVYQSGRYMSYPPSVIDLVKLLKFRIFPATLQFFFSKLNLRDKNNVAALIRARVGKTLANKVILPAVKKVWGNLEEISPELALSRIQIPSIIDIVKRIVSKNTSQFEALKFWYPKGGLSNLWFAIQKECTSFGAEFRSNTRVLEVKSDSVYLSELILTDGSRIELGHQDLVVSTLSISSLGKMLKIASSEFVSSLDLKLVFIKSDKPMNRFSWVFVSDESMLTHRASSQSAFDPDMNLPNDVVCLEYMDRGQLPSDDTLKEIAKEEFKKLFNDLSILDVNLVTLKNSYPTFSHESIKNNELIIEKLNDFKNLISIGRHGASQYVGSLDAFDMGIKVLDWAEHPTDMKKQKYRKQTSFYPILD